MMTGLDSIEIEHCKVAGYNGHTEAGAAEVEHARNLKSTAKRFMGLKDYVQAENNYREALVAYASLASARENDFLGDYVFVLEELSRICRQTGRMEEALRLDWELLEQLRKLTAMDKVTYLDVLVLKLEDIALACERRHEVFAGLGYMMEALRLAEDLPQAWKDAGNPLERMKAELTRMDALQDEIEVGGEWIYKDYPKNYFKR